jgi:outer membrane protein OmpA-like peptidoglycan-associated protein
MIGDKVEASQPSIDLKMNIVPDMVLSYFELFDEPQSYPGSFELSEEGRQRLKIVGQQLGKMPVGLLMVQGFTDRNGPSEINQVESYQRALTVRQHLIEELGFDPKRVEAIGFGEGEPTDHSMVSGYIINNRRIVLKVLNSI